MVFWRKSLARRLPCLVVWSDEEGYKNNGINIALLRVFRSFSRLFPSILLRGTRVLSLANDNERTSASTFQNFGQLLRWFTPKVKDFGRWCSLGKISSKHLATCRLLFVKRRREREILNASVIVTVRIKITAYNIYNIARSFLLSVNTF